MCGRCLCQCVHLLTNCQFCRRAITIQTRRVCFAMTQSTFVPQSLLPSRSGHEQPFCGSRFQYNNPISHLKDFLMRIFLENFQRWKCWSRKTGPILNRYRHHWWRAQHWCQLMAQKYKTAIFFTSTPTQNGKQSIVVTFFILFFFSLPQSRLKVERRVRESKRIFSLVQSYEREAEKCQERNCQTGIKGDEGC